MTQAALASAVAAKPTTVPSGGARSRLARAFLGLNAGFSIICGGALVGFAGDLAGLLFAAQPGWLVAVLRGLGVGLILFALDLLLMAKNRRITKGQVLLVCGADVAWIAGSVVLLVVFGAWFTATGWLVVAAVAVAVAIFAAGQWVGAGRIAEPLSVARARWADGVLALSVTRPVNAPVATVWRVMTDHPGYADVAANIAKVEVLSGDGLPDAGLGLRRRCADPDGNSWTETCDVFEPEKVFGFTIDTQAPDYPYPIAALTGRWSVKPAAGVGARVGAVFAIDIAAQPAGNAVQRWLFATLARGKFKGVLLNLADAWAARMEREAAV